jgi:long-chain acyl-CoA synthetase
MNLAAHLERRARESPAHPAILFEGRSISYGELDADASRLAHALAAHGVVAGDRVALYLPNVPAFAVCYYAAQKLGAIAVSINAIFKAAEVEYLVDDSGSVLLFTLAELAANLPRDRCPALRHVVIVDAPTPGTAADARSSHLADWLADAAADRFEPVERDADDPAALLYSSGTTGFPKGVTLTQHNIASNVDTAAKASGYRSDDRLALFLPLFHVYGQNYIMNAAVQAGATMAMFRRFVSDDVLAAIERDRITMFFGVPTIFIGLLNMDLSKWDLSSIRYEMSAASTMPEEISRRWTERFGRRVFEGYGLTECSPFACYNDAVEHRFGSVGRAVRDFTLAIFDENDREVGGGEWGGGGGGGGGGGEG